MPDRPLCYAPFIGLFVSQHGRYGPCCVIDKHNDVSPENYWTSKQLVDMRASMINHVWPSSCSMCKSNVANNINTEKDLWDDKFNSNPVELDLYHGNQSKGPNYIDFRPGIKCNLKCRMCTPYSSDLINNEIKQNVELKTWWKNSPNEEELSFNSFMDYYKKCDIKGIKLLGGEPTLNPNALTFIEDVINNFNPVPHLRITTNGTNLNKKFYEALRRYNNITLAFSVDAIDQTYNYIRTNGDWSTTKKFIERS